VQGIMKFFHNKCIVICPPIPNQLLERLNHVVVFKPFGLPNISTDSLGCPWLWTCLTRGHTPITNVIFGYWLLITSTKLPKALVFNKQRKQYIQCMDQSKNVEGCTWQFRPTWSSQHKCSTIVCFHMCA